MEKWIGELIAFAVLGFVIWLAGKAVEAWGRFRSGKASISQQNDRVVQKPLRLPKPWRVALALFIGGCTVVSLILALYVSLA